VSGRGRSGEQGAAVKKVAVLYSGGRQWGGIETYLLQLFRLNDGRLVDLVLLSMGEWELTRAVAALAESSASAVASPRCRVLSAERVRLRTISDIRRILREENADLLVSQGVVANAYARLAARAAHIPHLAVVHSDLATDYPRPLTRYIYRSLDRLLRPLTHRYIAVAAFLKERLVASGVDPSKVRVIYNGLAADAAATDGTVESAGIVDRAQGGGVGHSAGSLPSLSDEGGLTLVSIGRLHPVKNFDSLILAMGLLPDRVRLEIWGSGPEASRLQTLIAARGLEGRVELCGEAAAVETALARADAYVQASKSEGCSFAVIEAMLAGKPVVVTSCGGLPEQVENGRTGIVAAGSGPEELAAAIRRLLDERSLTEQLARAGREAARRQFARQRWLEETLSAFAEAAG
jgi:glycosyltransferase involved in cell wall biosynthesis